MNNTRKINWLRLGIFISSLFTIALVILVTIILIKRSSSTQIMPVNSEQVINVSAMPTVNSNKTSTIGTTATISPVSTSSPTIIDEPLSSVGELANGSNSWYYLPAQSLFTDTKATTDENMLKLAQKYRGIWQQDTNEKVVYITMDTGEDCISNLNKILNVAKEKNVTITFFLTGTFVKQFPDMILRMTNEGHIVANHTYNHPNLPNYLDKNGEEVFKKQITDVENEYKKVTGKDMIKILRPPEGAYSERVFAITAKMGYRLGLWSFAYKDWISNEQPTYEYALDKVLGQAHPGSVILLHPKSATNTAILSEVIDKLKERGYSFKGLDAFP